MLKHTLTPIKVLSFLLLISSFFSCSKDSDLFAEVVLLDEINTIEDLGTNSSSQEETDVTIDLENGIFETDEDKIAVFNVTSLGEIKNGKFPVLKNIVQPINGQIDIEKDSIIRYMPNADFNGTDYFEVTIEVTDDSDVSYEKEVTLEVIVNPISDIVDDILQVAEITEMDINVLSNDSFEDKNNVIISEISEPSHGTVVLNADNSILYTPSNQTAADSFTYTASVIHEDQTVNTEVGRVSLEIIPSSSATLLFKHGFEGNISIIKNKTYNGYSAIVGVDSETGGNFETLTYNGGYFAGIHNVMNFGEGTTYDDNANNTIVTVIGRDGNPTQALKQVILDWPNERSVTQSTIQINGITTNPTELYIRMWMKMPHSDLDKPYDWKVGGGYKTAGYDAYGGGLGYRLAHRFGNAGSRQVNGPGAIGEFFTQLSGNIGEAGGDTSRNWSITNWEVFPPDNEWFLYEYYIDWGDGVTNGHTWWKIDGKLVGEHFGRLTQNETVMKYLFLIQCYGGNSWPSTQYIDDIEIWQGVPY